MAEQVSKEDLIARVHEHYKDDRHTRQWVEEEVLARQGWQFYHGTMHHIDLAENIGVKMHQLLQDENFRVINHTTGEFEGGVDCFGCGSQEVGDSVTIEYRADDSSVADMQSWGVGCITTQYDAFGPRRRTNRRAHIDESVKTAKESAERRLVDRVVEHYKGKLRIEDITPELRAKILDLTEQDQALLARYKAIDYDYAQQRQGMLEEARVRLEQRLNAIVNTLNNLPPDDATENLRKELARAKGHQSLRNVLLNNPNIDPATKDKVERMYAVSPEKRLTDGEYTQVMTFLKLTQQHKIGQFMGSVLDDIQYAFQQNELSGEAYLWVKPIIDRYQKDKNMAVDGFTALRIRLADPRDTINVRVEENTKALREVDQALGTSMIGYLQRVIAPAYQRDLARYSERSELQAAKRRENTDKYDARIAELSGQRELSKDDYSLVKRLVQTTFTEAPSAAAIEGRLVESRSRRDLYSLVTGDLKLLTQKARYQSWANQRHKGADAVGQAYVFLEDLADKLDLNDVQVAATALKQG
ncbi:MAG: hypothetical protein KJ922_03480, partial [Nanoarchaeota archaeon]|nr:hypothetical protein [Nanoarchaeota archaeon]